MAAKKATAKKAAEVQKPWAERRPADKDLRPEVLAAYEFGSVPNSPLEGPALGPYRPPREP